MIEENIKNSSYHFNQALCKLNPKYKNVAQIRQSVITEWLKEKGFTDISVHGRPPVCKFYGALPDHHLEDLKEALNKHHPLKITKIYSYLNIFVP